MTLFRQTDLTPFLSICMSSLIFGKDFLMLEFYVRLFTSPLWLFYIIDQNSNHRTVMTIFLTAKHKNVREFVKHLFCKYAQKEKVCLSCFISCSCQGIRWNIHWIQIRNKVAARLPASSRKTGERDSLTLLSGGWMRLSDHNCCLLWLKQWILSMLHPAGTSVISS